VILGFSVQTFRNFEIIIADDGSREATKNLIDKLRTEIDIPIIHVWQEDNGFQKSQILNKAILKSTSEYLIFTDGDCIPRNDFVQNHLKQKEFGFFLSGGYFKLPIVISKLISENDIVSQNCFTIMRLKKKWIKNQF
jgi:glycosyltransferase involved in cell wall biosynthesis